MYTCSVANGELVAILDLSLGVSGVLFVLGVFVLEGNFDSTIERLYGEVVEAG